MLVLDRDGSLFSNDRLPVPPASTPAVLGWLRRRLRAWRAVDVQAVGQQCSVPTDQPAWEEANATVPLRR